MKTLTLKEAIEITELRISRLNDSVQKEESKALLESLVKRQPVHTDTEAVPPCNINNPNDPHYGDYGAYLSDCTWVPY